MCDTVVVVGRDGVPTDTADDASLWWRHERLHRRVLRDPERLLPIIAGERDALEARWADAPPPPAAAFAEADRALARWTRNVDAVEVTDTRPGRVRRYWRERDRRARLEPAGPGPSRSAMPEVAPGP
jgi:secernin